VHSPRGVGYVCRQSAGDSESSACVVVFYRPRLDAFDAAGALRPGVCDFLERCFFRCLLVNCPQIFVMMPVMGLVVWLLSGIGPQGNDDY